ncbi:MAG TPA: trypsin-like peptidase domain-containing protein [Clostridia bacterium]|nr:trypsin-like peptidase domain-containing protein [Clostridia bacterium]
MTEEKKNKTKYWVAGIAILLVGTMIGSVIGLVASGIFFTTRLESIGDEILAEAKSGTVTMLDEYDLRLSGIEDGIDALNNNSDESSEKLLILEENIIDMQAGIEEAKSLPEIPDMLVSDGYSETIKAIAQKALPSVVGVRTIETVTNFFRGSYDIEGIGTGVIVSEDGLILTNQHVVTSNPKSVTVTLIDGTEHDATVMYTDEIMDLAIIKIDATGLVPAEIGDSSELTVGETAVAIGNPLGLEYERSVTAGIISALGRSLQLSTTQIAQNLIQTDAAINSGNSGGPLLNTQGQVIGINTYKDMDGEAIGFAIPVNIAVPFVNQIKETGTYQGVQLGAVLLDRVILKYYTNDEGIVIDEGIYIYDVKPGSDAESKGLTTGDIVLSINGVAVNTNTEFRSTLGNYLPGDIVTLEVLRNSAKIELKVALEASGN